MRLIRPSSEGEVNLVNRNGADPRCKLVGMCSEKSLQLDAVQSWIWKVKESTKLTLAEFNVSPFVFNFFFFFPGPIS